MTKTSLTNYLERMDMNIVKGVFQEAWNQDQSLAFLPFEWQRKEEDDMVRATAHLNEQLRKFIPLGPETYQLYDVHLKKQLLNVNDERYGKLKVEQISCYL